MRTIAACLDALLMAGERWPAPVPIVVVDNGSTDGTVELVRERYESRIQMVEHPVGTVGAVRNLGTRHLRTDLLSFVDADCVVIPHYFQAAWAALRSSGAAAVGAPYALPPDPGWIERTWDAMHQLPVAGPAEWLYAGNMVVRSEAFHAIGGFSESLPSGEDPDLGRRLRERGYALHSDPALVAVHLGNPRTLRAFFRQQWWHGLGAPDPVTPLRQNRPFLMTLALLALTVVWAVTAAAGILGTGPALFSALLLSQALVPGLTVVFRSRGTRRVLNPAGAILLYWIYYWARAVALASVKLGFPRPPRGRS